MWISSLALLVLPMGGADKIEGDQPGARLGSSLATADVNGDGYADLIVGAPGFDDLYADEGRVTVYLGSSGGLSSTPDWTRYGRQKGAHFGAEIANAGDVNGDGYEDVLVGAPTFDRIVLTKHFYVGPLSGHASHSTDEGRVQLFLGSAAGLAGLPQRTVTGIERDERFGTGIAGAGDVNGDGYDDVLVGGPGKSAGLGALFLFPGSASGMAPLPSWIELGTEPGSDWGSQVAPAGDMNADGYADFLGARPESTGCSQLVLFQGTLGGPSAGEAINTGVQALGPAADYDLDGKVEALLIGDCNNPGLRWRRLGVGGAGSLEIVGTPAAVTAGDVNGDGLSDLIASAPDFANAPLRGRVFVYVNRPGLAFQPAGAYPVYDGDQAGAGWGQELTTGDVDGDGAAELFIGAPQQDAGETDEGIVQVVAGWLPELSLGQVPPAPFLPNRVLSAAAVGDFDGDGFDDLVSQVDYEDTFEVRYGQPAGLPASPDATLNLPPLLPYTIIFASARTGDVNGDGREDVLLVLEAFIPSHGAYAIDALRHALYLGSPAGLSTTAAWVIDGGNYGEASFVGDVNGDGYEDVYVVNYPPASDELFTGSSSGLSTTPWQTFPYGYTNGSSALGGSSRNRAILPGNLDGDAFADVLVTRREEAPPNYTYLETYLGSSSGLVQQEPWYFLGAVSLPCYGCIDALVLEDLDGDGLDDLVFDYGDEAAFLHRTPTGFVRVRQWWEPVRPSGSSQFAFWNKRVLALTDLDGDGWSDLLLEGQALHRGGPAGFERSPAWTGSIDHALQDVRPAADFDGDGLPELWPSSSVFPTYGMKIYEAGP